jgi:hypothetical protein
LNFVQKENIGVGACLKNIKLMLDLLNKICNMQFVVAQTGSLVMEEFGWNF